MDKFLIKKQKTNHTPAILNNELVNENESNESETELKSKKCYLFNGKFFTIVNEKEKKITAQCQNCSKIINGQRGSTGNFLSHIKYKHPSLLAKVKENKNKEKSSNKEEKIAYQTYTNNSQKLSKQKITNLVFEYIVEEMRPLITCEKPAFRQLIKGLTGLDNTAFLPDRRAIFTELKIKYQSYVTMLTELIEKQSFVCTTADIWSSNNKSYLGMTVHFIDEHTYIRYSYILGCKRIKGSHTFTNIAEVMNEITQIFNLSNTKISHTVTDNASNFGKAFRMYSMKSIGLNSLNISNDGGNWFSSESNSDKNNIDEYNSDANNSDIEIDNLNIDFDTIDFSSFNTNSEDAESDDIHNIYLPDHITCSAHTLSLIATADTDKISDKSYIKISKCVFNKLCSFWNLLSRSTVASDLVYDICHCKFPVPIITRWNSTFHAIQKIVMMKENIKLSFEKLKLDNLNKREWSFLEEYCSVMEPIAFSLDKLQGEKSCFLGYVAPTIITLRLLLIKKTSLIFCRPLALLIIESLQKRFNFIFDLKHNKSKPYIIAAIAHPKFKLSWIPVRYMTYCKNLFISECNSLTLHINSVSNSTDDNNVDSDEEFYNILSEDKSTFNSLPSSKNININSNVASIQALSYLDSNSKDFDILDTFPIVKKVFLKYNTTLPSSAPVERLFSSGIQILTPRRNRLQDNTFEMLLCCRSLMKNL